MFGSRISAKQLGSHSILIEIPGCGKLTIKKIP
jgi:hypothetical protein